MTDTNLIPKTGDPKVGYKVFTLLSAVLEDKASQKLPAKWNRFYELGKNKHWKQESTRASLVSANLLFAHRQRTVNMLTDNNPTFNISRQGNPEDSQEEMYDALLKTAEHWWQDQEQQYVLEKSVINAETFGCNVEKVIFNPDLEFGIGEVETEIIAPYYFGFYPVKGTDVQKAEAIFHFYPMSCREAKRRWPDKAGVLKPDSDYLAEINDTRREIAGGRSKGEPQGYFSTFGSVVKQMLNNSGGAYNDEDDILIVECWTKDYSGEYTGNIRVITTCNGGKVVLSDRDNPSVNPLLPPEEAAKTYLYDKYPFTLTPSITDTVSAWGMSDFEQLEALQIEINKSLSQITLLKDKASRLKIINPKDSGVPNAHFTNYPGILNPSNSMVAQGIRYMDPPQIPSDLVQSMDIYRDYFFMVSGSFDLEQAQTPGREVIAYKAIAALIERASTMMKGKIRNYGKMIRERGRMYLSHVMNWYTEERYIQYEEEGETQQMPILGQDLIVPAKLTVVSGSTMPRSKVQEREESLALFEKGAIDQTELLKRLDWPDRSNVLRRMQQGPLSDLQDKLSMIGAPEEFMQLLTQLQQMESKDVENSIEEGQIPAFQQIIAQMAGQQQQMEPEPDPTLQSELGFKQAQIDKIHADINLILEKINTEKVDQYVKQSGVEFDKEKLRIEKAQTISDISSGREKLKLDKANTVVGIKTRMDQAEAAKKAQDNDKYVKSAEQKGTKPYREKGMESNNDSI